MHKMPKVIFILPSLNAGGAERVLLTLFNNYPDPSKEMIVLNGSGPLKNWLLSGVPFTNLDKPSVLHSLWSLLCVLRKKRPDVIVSTMAHMNFGVLMLKPFLRGRPTVIVREANIPSAIIANRKRKRIVTRAYRLLYPLADRVIAPSRRIIDDFASSLHMRTDRYEVLYNPVDTERIRAKAVQAFSASMPCVLHFVCVGRLVYAKGLDRLIEALPGFSPNHDWRLTIVGEGRERAALESLIVARGLQNRITLVGLQENPWGYMAGADALLLPSRWEGLPNVALEALAVGTPVIAMASAGGIGEIAVHAPDHVHIAETMDDFIRAAERLAPSGHKSVRESLLPEIFYLNAVIDRFGDLVASAHGTPSLSVCQIR